MALAIDSVMPSRFPTWVQRRPFMILFLGDGATVPRSRLVVEGMDVAFPDLVGAGWMSRTTAPSAAWWEQHFRTELGPFERGRAPAAGTYLFHLGWVAAHHPPVPGMDRDGWLRVRTYLTERIKLKHSHGADETEWVRTGGSGGGPTPVSRAVVRRARDEGPYEVLEVSADASDDEVKAAYRTALKLNHPDRVSHLSKQIQAFAQERTQLIVEAWRAIQQDRGLR